MLWNIREMLILYGSIHKQKAELTNMTRLSSF